jgi:hypothetical protein
VRLQKRVDDTKLSDMHNETKQAPYGYIWHKYRPAILRLMVNAETAPQQYIFSDQEFKKVFPKSRNSLAFILYIHRSKALNNIKASPLAHALLEILQRSDTAIKLTTNSTYEFMLDEKFVFHVRKNDTVSNPSLQSTNEVSLEVQVE